MFLLKIYQNHLLAQIVYNFLIFDEDIAKKYYGSEYRVENQIKKLLPQYYDTLINNHKFHMHGLTSSDAYFIWTSLRKPRLPEE